MPGPRPSPPTSAIPVTTMPPSVTVDGSSTPKPRPWAPAMCPHQNPSAARMPPGSSMPTTAPRDQPLATNSSLGRPSVTPHTTSSILGGRSATPRPASPARQPSPSANREKSFPSVSNPWNPEQGKTLSSGTRHLLTQPPTIHGPGPLRTHRIPSLSTTFSSAENLRVSPTTSSFSTRQSPAQDRSKPR